MCNGALLAADDTGRNAPVCGPTGHHARRDLPAERRYACRALDLAARKRGPGRPAMRHVACARYTGGPTSACTPASSSEVPLSTFFWKPLPHQAPDVRGQDVQCAACLCCFVHDAHGSLPGSQHSRCVAQERADGTVFLIEGRSCMKRTARGGGLSSALAPPTRV